MSTPTGTPVDGAAKSGEQALARQFIERHPAECARLLEAAQVEDAAVVAASVPAEAMAEVIRRLTPEAAATLIQSLPPDAVQPLLAALNPNRVAALLARLPDEVREPIVERLGPLADEIRDLMSFPADSAGRLMDPRVLTFRGDMTVSDVIQRLGTLRRRRVQDIFVVDEDSRLVGALALQDAILAEPDAPLRSLIRAAPVFVRPTSPREEVLEELGRHRVSSLPVVDMAGHLIGVMRQEHLIAAVQLGATANMVTMVGASTEERALSGPWLAVRKRLPWLEVNLLTAFLAASVVGAFTDTIARVTALAILLPVVAGQSGNTGAQALAVTMRGLALREVRTRDWLRVVLKELAAGAINGVAVGLTTAGAVYLWSGSVGLTLVIGVSMVMSMTAAGAAGASIPMLLTAARQDPAQSSSIILTTVTDVVGFLSFLGIATALLSMLEVA